MRSKRLFKKVYKWYVIALTIIMIVCVAGVYRTLVVLEQNQPESYVKRTLASLDEDRIKSLFESNGEYENSKDLVKNIRDFFKSDKYTVKKEASMQYGVYLDNELIMKVFLKSNGHVNKLGLMSYDLLDVEKIEGKENKELYGYSITVPSNYKVKVNNKDLDNGEKTKIAGFLDAYDYVDIPTLVTYNLDHLTKEPTIDISVDNKAVSFEKSRKIDLSENFKKYDSLQDAGVDFDAQGFAEKWSLYLTNDLTGPLHGMYNITAHLIKGTSMYTKAYQWGTQVDILFTSRHTLKNPTFTNESVSNIIVYGDNAVSCDVKLEKNMIVNNADKVDYFNSTIYLVKYEDAWKVVNIKGVTNS